MPLLVRDAAMAIEKGHTMKISRLVIQSLCLLGLWLGLGLKVHAQTDTVTYVYTDPQGTPLVEADAQGNVIARYDYTPYGNAVASLGSPANGPGYTGHVNDPETGLVYMQARYYQPIGRFLSPDPVGPKPGNVYSFNRYIYAAGNPVLNVDPDGRQSIPVDLKMVAIRDSAGQIMMVPEGAAGASLAGVLTNSNISDITNPSYDRDAAANALDDASLGAGVVTVGISATPAAPLAVVTGAVDEATAVLAWAAKPTKERAINVATAQMARAIKIAAKIAKSKRVVESVEAAEKAKIVAEVAKKADEEEQKIREEQEQEQEQKQHEQQDQHSN